MKDEQVPKEVERSKVGKPLQMLSYADKIKDDYSWVKNNINYNIDKSSFGTFNGGTVGNVGDLKTKQELYDAYNNKIPESIFAFITNPLSTKDQAEKFKNFPAKIRAYNIIRPNIDLLIGEWNKRSFHYDVINADGDDAFNSFLEYQTKAFHDNVTQRYINTANALTKDATGSPSEEIPDPKTLLSELNGNYKDAKALKGYKALKVMELELHLREEWRKMFKDWLLAGDTYTLKTPLHGDIKYIKLSTQAVDYTKSTLSPYVEDGDQAVAYFEPTTAELVDLFYDKLTEKELKELEKEEGTDYPSKMFNSFNALLGQNLGTQARHKLYYNCFKTRVKKGYLTYPDPATGEMQSTLVDEDYKVDPELGESIEWLWLNEVWEGWRINDNRFIGMGPIQGQRNEMNNFAACKLPINGKRFSDTEGNNISVAWLGMPYQIMFMVLMYRLELTIAKSKGKIVLMPEQAIPDGDEESFFWYADAMNFALINPEGLGGFNNYQVLDLSLFQHIQELISIIDYVKGQWDELLGITRQRKGQNAASDGLQVTEQSIFRSSVISDLIFTGFEEFLERELTGLLDISKYAWVDGKKGQYRNDDGRMEMLSLDGEDYVNSQYGVYVQNMSAILDKFNMLKQNINAIAQRKDVKTSTIIDLAFTDSITELRALVKKAEAVEVEIAKATAANQQEAEKAQLQIQQENAKFLKYLDVEMMHQEYDRKDNEIYIQGEVDQAVAGGIVLDPTALEKESNARLDRLETSRIEREKLGVEKEWQNIERENIKSKEKIAKENNKTKLKNKVTGEK